MNLFERLLHRRLCNEQPADGGTAPAPSEPPAPAADPAKPEGDKPQHGAEGDKPQDDKPADGDKPADKPDDKEQKQEGAPEKYEFQAGEGVELDAEALKDFEPVARELNLAGVQQRQADAWQAQTEEWAATVKADKEIGGDKLTANLGVAQRALDTFGTPELKEYLNGTGLGNHPELVKAFVKVGKAMSEDGVVTGKESGQRSAAEVLYGK